MLTLKQKLGARIKKLRKEAGLSQQVLCELVGLDIPNLSNIETGKRFMTAQTLENLAKALNTTERELFDFNEEEPLRYVRSEFLEIINSSTEKEINFFLEIIKSYKKLIK